MEKRPGYKIIEDGAFADFEFEATASTLPELFGVCAQALFGVMTDLSKVAPREMLKFALAADTREDLLFAFLAELIYIKDVHGIFLKDFKVSIIDEFKLECQAAGEHIDNEKHEILTDVKAVTYHKLTVRRAEDGYTAHVILDL